MSNFIFRKLHTMGPVISEDKAGKWVKAYLIDPEEREPQIREERYQKATDPRVICDFQEFVPFGTTHEVALEEAKARAIDWKDYMGSRLAEANPENTRKGVEIDEQDTLLAQSEALESDEDEILYVTPPLTKGEVVTHLVISSYGPGYATV